uniref:Uncharacterized protein n=1 Tax=Oryza rufipogon TaxID=4529 RepID=A0A0E0QN47_ORYRU
MAILKERKRNKPSFHMTHTTTYNSDVVSSMEDHRGEGNDGGIRMISSDELCKHVAASDRLKHPIDKLRTTKDFATNPAEDSGWREGTPGCVDDEAGEEEEEPKLEHDKHEGHCMAGSAATSNLGDLRGAKGRGFWPAAHPERLSPAPPVGAVAQQVVDGNESAGDERRRGDGHRRMMQSPLLRHGSVLCIAPSTLSPQEALVLPTQNPKLFTPVFLLIALPSFLVLSTNVLFVQPLSMDMAELAIKLQTTDPSSAEYRMILEELKHDVTQLILVVVAVELVALVLGFVNQCVGFFAASSTYSGDRYSLPELLRKAMKGNLKGPLITIAMVTVLRVTYMALLGVLIYSVMQVQRHYLIKVLSVQVLLFVLCFLAFLYFNVVGMVSVAVSVGDTERRGIRALRQAWRLMTRVRRKEGLVLVVAICLLSIAVSPVNLVAAAYTKNMVLGLCLLVVYALLSGAEQLFYFAAATVYYCQAMDSKGEAMDYAYAKIPTVDTLTY